MVWTLRTTHTGNSVRLRPLPWLKLPTQWEDRLPSWLSLDDERERMAMFASYAAVIIAGIVSSRIEGKV